MASIGQRLAQHKIIGLDTSIFIYHIESNPRYQALTKTILSGVQSGQYTGVTSTITLMELTVHPWRANRANVAREYEVMLSNFPNLYTVDVTRDVARRAAQLRAIHNLSPADALQVASALVHQATLWVSNDKRLKRVASMIDVLILDDFLEAHN